MIRFIKIPILKCNAAGAVAASNIIGAVAGIGGQLLANESNEKLAEINNQKMIQAMREQTKAEQNYNSVGAQMKRIMAAGINPMTLAGNQPTSASASGVPSLDTPVVQNPFAGVDFGIGEAVSTMNQAKALEIQSSQVELGEMKINIDMLRTIGDLMKDVNLTSDDASKIVNSVLGDRSPFRDQVVSLLKDENIKSRLTNEIKISNLNVKEKEYLYGWLDDFTNAEYTNILAGIEERQTASNVNRSTVDLQQSMQRLNDSKRREVEQAILNMQEQWKSLNFQGELDSKKLLRVAEISESIVNTLVNEAEVSRQEATYWVWKELNKVTVTRTDKVGPFSITRSGSRNDVKPNLRVDDPYNNPISTP